MHIIESVSFSEHGNGTVGFLMKHVVHLLCHMQYFSKSSKDGSYMVANKTITHVEKFETVTKIGRRITSTVIAKTWAPFHVCRFQSPDSVVCMMAGPNLIGSPCNVL